MALPELLGTKNPKDFFNVPVRIRYQDGLYHATIEGPQEDFQSMLKRRKQPCNPEAVRHGLEGDGYVFANLGLSIALTLNIDGRNFAVVARQERADLGDTVGKLISGYIDARKIFNPLQAVDEELAEEFLPYSEHQGEARLLSGMRRLSPLPKPFEGVEGVTYDESFAYQLVGSRLRVSPDLADGEVVIAGKEQTEGSPRLYYQISSNSAQLVYNFHADIPRLPSADITLANAERSYLVNDMALLGHSEDKFDPKTGTLAVRSHEYGLLLVALTGERLTDRVYTFERGKLDPYDRELELSEAFAPKENGIAARQSISLTDYLNKMNPSMAPRYQR